MTDATGTLPMGNGGNGVLIAELRDNTIGGTVSGAGNRSPLAVVTDVLKSGMLAQGTRAALVVHLCRQLRDMEGVYVSG